MSKIAGLMGFWLSYYVHMKQPNGSTLICSHPLIMKVSTCILPGGSSVISAVCSHPKHMQTQNSIHANTVLLLELVMNLTLTSR